MNRLLRRLLLAAAAAIGLPAAASTHSTDYTDLWYLPTESGWGVNVVQQYDTVFATFFIYGADDSPRWYVAPAARSVASPPGRNQFAGSLYSTVGTWFGVPWDPADYSLAEVGSVTFNFETPTTGTVTWTVSGVTATRSIVRQTWGGNVLTGNYIGGISANGTNCNGVDNGPILIHGELTIGHSNIFNPTFRIDFFTAAGQEATCTFTGTYAQEGRMGRVSGGTWGCQIAGVSNPPAGTFSLSQIEANTKGLNARFTGADQNCSYDGYFGGIKDVL
jgi:hypothetical protein